MDQQLLIGVVLIVVGLAFGLIAAAVVVNRRIDADERSEVEQDEAKAEQPEALAASGDATAADADPTDRPVPANSSLVAPPTQAGDAPAEPADSLLGELHRDLRTGAIFFRRSDREYRSADDIQDRDERRRLAGAVSDWAAWFRESDRTAASSAPSSPSSMVQAIDAILQRSLQGADVSTRGVRLIQDASGGVKVLIGVKSYEVEDVPDEEIRRLIRQAVAEWEAQQ